MSWLQSLYGGNNVQKEITLYVLYIYFHPEGLLQSLQFYQQRLL